MPLIHAALVLVLLSDVLFQDSRIVGIPGGDLRTQYVFWRQFAFDQIRNGHFPLWNPHVFAGTPFFGDPQSAMLYPLNWVHLFLPMAIAVNWLIALHLFMAAWFCGIWCRGRGLSVMGATLAGIIYICSGPVFANLIPGHLPLICSVAWFPLLLWCVDGVLEKERVWGWMLAGAGVAALLAVDGYPQFAYESALAVGVYAILYMPGSRRGWKAIPCLAGIFILGWGMAGVQLLAAWDVARESQRSGGLPYWFAVLYALPPENFVTLVAPGFFGIDAMGQHYWGKWNLWEVNVFIGAAALVLAMCGALGDRRRGLRPALLAALFFLPAVGTSTPVFWLMYRFVPGFSNFRAPARFDLFSIFYLAFLAGLGLDALMKWRPGGRWIAAAAATVTAAGAACLAGWSSIVNQGWLFQWCIRYIVQRGASDNSALDRHLATNVNFVLDAARHAGAQLERSGILLLVCAAVLIVARRFPRAAVMLAIIAVGELSFNAMGWSFDSPVAIRMPPVWEEGMTGHDAGRRIVCGNAFFSNEGMTMGFDNVGGGNPLLLHRTNDFLAVTQGINPMGVGFGEEFNWLPPSYRMLRADLLLYSVKDVPRVGRLDDVMGHVALLGRFKMAHSESEALGIVTAAGFDPGAEVVLESQPDPAPSPARGGSARIVSETTDQLEIEVDLTAPKILLVTDAYARGWRVRPLDGDGQPNYQVMPGDYMLRAIPLAAGHHHFVLEYRPVGFEIGKWISMGMVGVYLIALVGIWAKGRKVVAAKTRGPGSAVNG